jgi:hypothetical protein
MRLFKHQSRDMAAIDDAIDDAMTLARAMVRDGKMPEAGLNEVDAIPWFVKRVVEREISFTPEVTRGEILERVIAELKKILDLSQVATTDHKTRLPI